MKKDVQPARESLDNGDPGALFGISTNRTSDSVEVVKLVKPKVLDDYTARGHNRRALELERKRK